MSTVEEIVQAVKHLSPKERRELDIRLAKESGGYGELSDEALCEIADQTFQRLDQEEADAQSRKR